MVIPQPLGEPAVIEKHYEALMCQPIISNKIIYQ